ncbi:MAG TPA: porin [Terriglobales bacterium]|nr:porin [Terriglobales bacterium]
MRTRWFLVGIVVLLTSFSYSELVPDAPADPASAPPAASPASAAVESPAPPPAPAPTVSFSGNGLVFSSEDRSTFLRVHGFIQGDGRFFSSDQKDHSPDILMFRRIRPTFDGTLFNFLDYTFIPDFGLNRPQVQEMWVELKPFTPAKLRVGKFKTPLGLEALRSDLDSSFAERSLASDLVPLREVGAQIGGSVLKKSITYAVGYFNGTTDGSNGNFEWRQSNEAVMRIFALPFTTTKWSFVKGLGIGMAGSFANEHGTVPSFKTVSQNTFFKYSSTAVAAGAHHRVAPQAYYYYGPLGILGEYTISAQDVRNKQHLGTISNTAWDLAGSFLITGEKNSYSGIRPKRSFEPQRGFRNMGAWELVVRYSQLRVDPSAFPLFANATTQPKQADEYGIGVNWYLNRYVKLMSAYEHTSFTMASRKATPLHGENVLMSRIQLAF